MTDLTTLGNYLGDVHDRTIALVASAGIDDALDFLSGQATALIRETLDGCNDFHVFTVGGISPQMRLVMFKQLNQEGLIPAIRQMFDLFVVDILSALRDAVTRDLSAEEVDTVWGITSFMDTPDGLLEVLRSRPLGTSSHALLHHQNESLASLDWRRRLSGTGTFATILASLHDFANAFVDINGLIPIAIATQHQFNAVNVPSPGTIFECLHRESDNVVVAHRPGLVDEVFGICPCNRKMNEYLVRVLRNDLYSVRGLWGEDFSVFQHGQEPPLGQRFLVTLVFYVSVEVPEQGAFADFCDRFQLGKMASAILPCM